MPDANQPPQSVPPTTYVDVRVPVPAKVKAALEEKVRQGEAGSIAALLHPLISAFSRGEIQMQFAQAPPK